MKDAAEVANNVPRPFSSPIVEISFNSSILSVHRAFLEERPLLNARVFSPSSARSGKTSHELCLSMTDTSILVGHVFVNWLYTGTYQLIYRGPSSSPSPQQALSTALGVYSLARRYRMSDLESLAARALCQLKTQVDIVSLIEIIEVAYPQTIGNDRWMQDFLAQYIKDSMTEAKTAPPAVEPNGDDRDVPITKLIVRGLLDACGEAMRDVAAREAALAEGGNAMAPKPSTEDGHATGENEERNRAWKDAFEQAFTAAHVEQPASIEAESTAPDTNDWVMASPHPSDQLEAQPDLVEGVKKPKSLKAKKKKEGPPVEPEPEPETAPLQDPEPEATLRQEPEPIPEHPISEHVPEIPSDFQEDPEITAIKKEKKAKLKERKAKKKRLALALQAELEQLGQGDMPDQDLEPAIEPEVVQLGPVHVVVEGGPSEFAKVKKPKKKKKETSGSGELPEEKVEEEVVIFTPVHG